jgi:hypothetical protein
MEVPMALVDRKARWGLTGKDVPLQMLVSGKGLTAVGTENHFRSMETSRRRDKEDG